MIAVVHAYRGRGAQEWRRRLGVAEGELARKVGGAGAVHAHLHGPRDGEERLACPRHADQMCCRRRILMKRGKAGEGEQAYTHAHGETKTYTWNTHRIVVRVWRQTPGRVQGWRQLACLTPSLLALPPIGAGKSNTAVSVLAILPRYSSCKPTRIPTPDTRTHSRLNRVPAHNAS